MLYFMIWEIKWRNNENIGNNSFLVKLNKNIIFTFDKNKNNVYNSFNKLNWAKFNVGKLKTDEI